MNSFTITEASKAVKLDKGSANVTFTVTNSTDKPLRGTPKLNPIRSTSREWLVLTGGVNTREFSAKETKTLVVQIKVPANAQLGEYSFGLNISNEANPDDDCTVGPAVAFKIEGAPPPGTKKPFPWWILIVVGVVLVGGGITVAILLKPSKQTVPMLVGKPIGEASNLVATAKLRMEVTEFLATGTNQIGIVITQTPKADEKVEKDGLVRLAVEREQDKVNVPRLLGLPPNRITDLFGALPLKFVAANPKYTGTQTPGLIAEQTPLADQPATPGATVTYTVEDKKPEPPSPPSAPPPPPPPPYLGNWVNEDSNTRSIPRFDVRQQNGKIYVHMYGKCSPTDCDWGEMEARPSGSDRLLITWDQGFVVRSQTLAFSNGKIRSEMRSNYKDNSGRAPQNSVESFKKRELNIIRDHRMVPYQVSPLLRKAVRVQ